MSITGYKYQCPRCRGDNRYEWPQLMLHYQTAHPKAITGGALPAQKAAATPPGQLL